MVGLSRPYPFKLFKDCLPQILRRPLLHTLSQMILEYCNQITYLNAWKMQYLTHFSRMPQFYTPWKRQKTNVTFD